MSMRERLEALWAPVRRWYEGHSERDRRIIAGVAGLAVLSLLYIRVYEPLVAYREGVRQNSQKADLPASSGDSPLRMDSPVRVT